MATVAVQAALGSAIIGCYYDPTGLAWVSLRDNQTLAWMVDQNNPQAVPTPVVVGTLPTSGPGTGAVVSPPWVQVFPNGQAVVPDVFRGSIAEMLTWIATNNGAQRQIYGDFNSTVVAIGWNQWAANNPTLVLPDAPPGSPAAQEAAPPMPSLRGHRGQPTPTRG
jgi:hypothetical protein